jgi:hypothetical protein
MILFIERPLQGLASRGSESDRNRIERQHRLSKIKFNGVGKLRAHIGFMRINDFMPAAHFPTTGF